MAGLGRSSFSTSRPSASSAASVTLRQSPEQLPEIHTGQRAVPIGGLRDPPGYFRGSETVPGAPYLIPRFTRLLRRRISTATIRIDARITNKVATERMVGLMFSRRPSNISRGKVR